VPRRSPSAGGGKGEPPGAPSVRPGVEVMAGRAGEVDAACPPGPVHRGGPDLEAARASAYQALGGPSAPPATESVEQPRR